MKTRVILYFSVLLDEDKCPMACRRARATHASAGVTPIVEQVYEVRPEDCMFASFLTLLTFQGLASIPSRRLLPTYFLITRKRRHLHPPSARFSPQPWHPPLPAGVAITITGGRPRASGRRERIYMRRIMWNGVTIFALPSFRCSKAVLLGFS